MAIDEKAAAHTIVAAVQAMKPAHAAAAGMPADFCTIWPQAKPILELLSGLASIIPGLGSVAGGVLKGLIAVGDQISAQVCKK
jgi:hypothetical protein